MYYNTDINLERSNCEPVDTNNAVSEIKTFCVFSRLIAWQVVYLFHSSGQN